MNTERKLHNLLKIHRRATCSIQKTKYNNNEKLMGIKTRQDISKYY